MRLKKIDIVKFRNLSNVSFEIPYGKKAIVFSGLNGIGKTTIIDSVMWILCDETIVYGKENSDKKTLIHLFSSRLVLDFYIQVLLVQLNSFHFYRHRHSCIHRRRRFPL